MTAKQNMTLLPADFTARSRKVGDSCTKQARKRLVELRAMGERADGTYDVDKVIAILNSYESVRIKRLADRYKMDMGKFLSDLLTIPKNFEYLAVDVLAKEPSRIVWQEKYQFEILKNHSRQLSALLNLPNGGANAKWLSHGVLTDTKKNSKTKSLDFVGALNDGTQIAVAAKYTEASGGAQDNQKHDLEEFAKEAGKLGEGCLVVLLADGASYSLPYKGEKDFRTYIEKTYGRQNVIATTTAEFDISIEKWLDRIARHGSGMR